MFDKILTVCAVVMVLGVAGCDPNARNKNAQAQRAENAAASIVFTENAEIDNIQRRITLTASTGALGFILLLNDAGQPIMYEGVTGKITSGGKRLTPPVKEWFTTGGGSNPLGPAPSDEGTWGSSSEYIFYWNTNGEYRQWNGKYLYADKPFRLRVEPIIMSIETKPAPGK